MTLKLNNRFENNIVADVIPPVGAYLKVVEGPMEGGSNLRNIFYSSQAKCTFITEPGVGTGKVGMDRRGRVPARVADLDSDYNIYYCEENSRPADQTLAKLQGEGSDANSRVVDPMFVDPENGDFSFKPGSPALKMGIVPIDLSKVGLQSKK